MTQIETIISEIERLKSFYVRNVNEEYRDFTILLLDSVIDSINSLPTEYPEDLEYLATSLEETIGTSPHSRETILDYLKQAAQLQKEQTINKAYKWLEDNVIDYVWCSEGDLGISDEFFIDFEKAMEDKQ